MDIKIKAKQAIYKKRPVLLSAPTIKKVYNKASLLKGMSEFREGEVSLVCRKNILIHSKGPGFCYFEDNRFK